MAIADIGADSVQYENKAAAPSGTEGDTYYNSTDKKLQVHDGTGFVDVGGGVLFDVDEIEGDYTIPHSQASTGQKGYSLVYGSLLGFAGGGSSSNVIEYINVMVATGNAADTGDLTVTRGWPAGCCGAVYGFFGGGQGPVNTIDVISVGIAVQNATDKGDLTVARHNLAGNNLYNSILSYGFFAGGTNGGTSDVIDYIVLSTATGNATDVGNLSVARTQIRGLAGSTYSFFMGGYTGSESNIIDYITNSSISQNALDVGDLSLARYTGCTVCGTIYGFYCGGYTTLSVNTIDYITLLSTSQNALDKGDLIAANHDSGGISGITYGFVCGGTGGALVIQYLDITTTTGNATDGGDLTVSKNGTAGVN